MWARRMAHVVLIGLLLSGLSLGNGLALASEQVSAKPEPVQVKPEPVPAKPAQKTRHPANRSQVPKATALPHPPVCSPGRLARDAAPARLPGRRACHA